VVSGAETTPERQRGGRDGRLSVPFTRTLKRVPVVELADAEHRKEAAARRAREYRDRQAEKAASPEALAEKLTGHPVDSADHLTIKTPRGDRIMFRSKRNGAWYREGVCGPVRAKRSDFEGKVPADFEAVPSYGPAAYPELSREALGYCPPDRKPIRLRIPAGVGPNRGTVERVSPGRSSRRSCPSRARRVPRLTAARIGPCGTVRTSQLAPHLAALGAERAAESRAAAEADRPQTTGHEQPIRHSPPEEQARATPSGVASLIRARAAQQSLRVDVRAWGQAEGSKSAPVA
jgi:hypothetical protein